ncbi:MAG TPA: hypothetical protein HPP66_04555 [Planctomycetes bacterium]|nr:hypothetical protein [Planctomycetota bacterium]
MAISGGRGGLVSLCGATIIIEAAPMTLPASRMTRPKRAMRRRCRRRM